MDRAGSRSGSRLRRRRCSDIICRAAAIEWRPEDPMRFVSGLERSGRFDLRFLCAAWLVGSAALARQWAGSPSAIPWLPIAFGATAVFGAALLWRTREDAAREVLESSAAVGFWAAVFAVIV
jgi:hypothetical protein